MSDLTKSWAICRSNGDLEVEDGRVLIFESRKAARDFLKSYEALGPVCIEKVEIR